MFEQVKLQSYSSFEPYIDSQTMEIHYTKHYATYTNNLNELIKQIPQMSDKPIEYILKNINKAPKKLRQSLFDNAGGYYNHSVYFDSLAPAGLKVGYLQMQFNKDFGGTETFIKEMSTKAISIFGSGWAWLIWDRNKLKIITTSNQDTPFLYGNYIPLLPLDIWEHAYYLKYKNVRADYIKAYFNIINWTAVEDKFSQK